MVLGLVGVYFLFLMGHHSLPSVWTYFTIERFDWNAREIGYSFAFIGILMAFTQAVLLQKVVPVLGQYKAALIGFAFCILSFIGYSIASSGWMLYMFMVPGALQGFVMPAINGIMSGQVPANSQGELQGGVASMSSLTAILSPPLMTWVFAAFSSDDAAIYFPGAPFALAAVLTTLGLLFFLRAAAPTPNTSEA